MTKILGIVGDRLLTLEFFWEGLFPYPTAYTALALRILIVDLLEEQHLC